MQSTGHQLYKVFITRRLPRGPNESFQPFEVRRFSLSCYPNYGALREVFESYFPSLKNTLYSILWADEDGDYIRVKSDLELLHAKEIMGTPPVFKFFAVPEDAVRSVVHDVACDSCEMDPIIGHRYECVECENYDLCRACEHRGVHAHHNMRRHATGRGFFLTGKVEKPQPKELPLQPSWRSPPPTSINDTKKTDLVERKISPKQNNLR